MKAIKNFAGIFNSRFGKEMIYEKEKESRRNRRDGKIVYFSFMRTCSFGGQFFQIIGKRRAAVTLQLPIERSMNSIQFVHGNSFLFELKSILFSFWSTHDLQNSFDRLFNQLSRHHSQEKISRSDFQRFCSIAARRGTWAFRRFVAQKRMDGVEHEDMTFERHGTIGIDLKFAA